MRKIVKKLIFDSHIRESLLILYHDTNNFNDFENL